MNATEHYITALDSIHPVLEVLETQYNTQSIGYNYDSELIDIIKLHSSLMDTFTHRLNDEGSVEEKIFEGRLSCFTYKFIATFIAANGGVDNLSGIEEKSNALLAIVTKASNSFLNQQVFETKEISARVILELLNCNLRFEKCVQIFVKDKQVNSYLTWFNIHVVLLAKDLAFNWSKTSTITDKESLFCQAIPYCADISSRAWTLEASRSLDSEQLKYNGSNFWELAPTLEKTLLDNDLGYASHPYYNHEWLKEKIESVLVNIAKNEVDILDKEFRHKAQSMRIQELQRLASEVWLGLKEETINHLNSLSQNELQEWKLNEGSEPVDFNKFVYRFDESYSHEPLGADNFIINNSNVEVVAKSHMARLWGVSNAIFKKKGN